MTHAHRWVIENVWIGEVLAAVKVCRGCLTIKAPVDNGKIFVIQGSRAEALRKGQAS